MVGHDLDGSPIHFSEFVEDVLVLNLWVPWHSPSIRQMPGLQRLREATSDLGVHFACVTAEQSEREVRAFLERWKGNTSLPLYVLDGELPQRFRTGIMPATFIVDRTGRVALQHVGPAVWDDESVVANVRGLAGAPGIEPHAPQSAESS